MCQVFSWWGVFPRISGDFLGRFRNAPGWPERKTQAWRDQDFSRISPREWGGEEGSCLCSRSCIAWRRESICSSRALTAPLRPSFSASSKAILCCKSCKPTLLIPVDSASLLHLRWHHQREPNTLISSDVSITLIPFPCFTTEGVT